MRVRVKICCIASVAEMRMAVEAGADAVGLVGAMPSGPGPIADDLAAEIAAATPPGVASFLLTQEETAEAISAHAARVRPNAVQIVRHVDPAIYPPLRAALPGVKLVQVIHVEAARSVERARAYAGLADALLLDSGRPSAAVAELGGTGRVHDWALSRRIVEQSSAPVFLAGGLGPANVAEAIRAVQPWGVDVCSGLRTEGALDAAKLAAYGEAVCAASLP